MLGHRNLFPLWLLLLPHVSGSAVMFGRQRNPVPQEGNVRLFGGDGADGADGRVEIYHGGSWGTVCDDDWDLAEAQVVCRQLRFLGAVSVVIGKDYGKVSGPIWLDDLTCKGTENYLSACGFGSWGKTDCTHKEDVGVICETGSSNVTGRNSAYSLDHSISLSDERGQIFDSGNSCDFLISVRSVTGNTQENETQEEVGLTICAHKLILSQFPLFNASEETTGITVDVDQSCEPHFSSFIRYIYTRQVDVTLSSVKCLHWMAYKFGVKQLMEETGRLFTKFIPEDASFQTQVSLHEYAVETEDFVLQETCIQYLAWNYQNLTMSPAWTQLSVELLGSLLLRSDLVVSDEYFLLQTVEGWIAEKGKSISLETQVDLLSRIRFPMIPAEALYDLESNSSLYSTHENLYRKNILRALQFNVLLFSKLTSNKKFDREDDDIRPRIYTAEPWSTAIDRQQTRNFYNQRYDQYNQQNPSTMYFNTPVHNSLIFKSKMIRWEANVFKSQYECSNRGVRCESFPSARLAPQNSLTEWSNILFRNRLLLMCQGKYIFQVQDFKGNMANMAVNGTQFSPYSCPDDQQTYRFVVRPEYV
ncbi:galectin-3-binding protein A-like [Anoplopoma fimbria]|uniref:galectin-3-binding protein A-like n=1 Tax=Anoplopoma fimbria TaxID=229290 RepID=UPI0023ED9B57|nr:galectin-3-binding protein A-like [Anoplopoma fimbria]